MGNMENHGKTNIKYMIPIPMSVRIFQHPIWRVFAIILFPLSVVIDTIYLISFLLEKIVPVKESPPED